MRKWLPLALLVCAGCPGLGQVAFDINSSGQSTVQGSPAGALISSFGTFGSLANISFSNSSDFSNNNTNKDHVTKAQLTRLTLKVVSPSSATLDFISTIEFDIGASNLPTVKIASGSIPAAATTVDLTCETTDLSAYVKADNFSITTKGSGHQPSQDTTVEADLTMHIEANVL
jgi:hypothetical protein